MGVKDLWTVLSPVCEKRSLWELQNKTIAIDLSAWICDSQCLSKQPQVNMYLRNLFFRTSYLLLLGVKPVFVLEGRAPELKAKTIQNRQNKTSKRINGNNVNKIVQRSRLKSLQKQCAELLLYLGLKCIEAPGEAEAFCAHLNRQGLVDGVVSQDSDAFLYGAREVYRNFQMAPKYTYDAYSMDKIEKTLKLSRTKLIGFSILSGSDYNSGIYNVGKETAIKFLMSVPDEQLYQRFLEWKSESISSSSQQQKQTLNKELEIEKSIREKALLDKRFPDLEVIAEFTSEPGQLYLEYVWNKPDLKKFVVLADKKLMWDEEYAAKKVIPLVGRWHLLNSGAGCEIKVTKIESAFGKNSHYKATWDLFDVVTIETKELVQKSYPDLVSEYEEVLRIAKLGKAQKRSRKKLGAVEIVPLEKVATNTLVNYFISDRSEVIEPIVNDNLLAPDEGNYLNLSGIVEDIVTRPNSNPAVIQLSKLL